MCVVAPLCSRRLGAFQTPHPPSLYLRIDDRAWHTHFFRPSFYFIGELWLQASRRLTLTKGLCKNGRGSLQFLGKHGEFIIYRRFFFFFLRVYRKRFYAVTRRILKTVVQKKKCKKFKLFLFFFFFYVNFNVAQFVKFTWGGGLLTRTRVIRCACVAQRPERIFFWTPRVYDK